MTVPEGCTSAIAEANYQGRARLYTGATGPQRTNYYWQGSSANSGIEQALAGPLAGPLGGPLGGYWPAGTSPR